MHKVPIAIAHDYLTQKGGAERVVLALSRAFPDAPIYTTLYNPATTYPEFQERAVVTSALNRVPSLRSNHRRALPLLARAAGSLLVDAEVTIASSSGWAHGFRRTGKLLVYCHNPARWLYQPQDYLGEHRGSALNRAALAALTPGLMRWDKRAAGRADRYLANSTVVSQRIAATYGITADYVPPPPGIVTDGQLRRPASLHDWEASQYWLVVSRLMPYKNVDKAVEAFRKRHDNLVIVGAGPQYEALTRDLPVNVRILSNVPDAELRWIYAHARGLVAPSFEDFGLTPLEANAWGLPVVALHAGGYLDTVVDGVSGTFFETATPSAISAAVDAALGREWSRESLIQHADAFSEERFAERIRAEVEDLRTQPNTQQSRSS